jgi:LacI family transcriptional regulator
VSYVLSGRTGGSISVADETRSRVLQAAGQLGYEPNSTAQSLRLRANKTIGLLVPDTGNPYYWQLLQGAEAEAQACGYDILLVNTALDPHREREAVRAVLRRRVDGLLIILAFRDQVIEEVRNIVGRRNAVVLIGEAATIDNRLDSVRSDHAGGALQMMAHLLALGHRHIGFVFGVAGPPLGQERLLAYRQSLQDAGVMDDASLVEHCGVTLEDGYRAAHRLLDRAPRPTAILVINDLLAIGVLRAINERGLRIPDEISVAGFDDIAMTRYLSPPLTTVRVHAEEVGRTAMRLCFERMRDPERPLQSVCVPAELVRRGSTGPVPISGTLPATGTLPAGAVPMGYAAELPSPALRPVPELQGASRARGDDPSPARLSKGGPIVPGRARTLNAAGSPA